MFVFLSVSNWASNQHASWVTLCLHQQGSISSEKTWMIVRSYFVEYLFACNCLSNSDSQSVILTLRYEPTRVQYSAGLYVTLSLVSFDLKQRGGLLHDAQ